MPEPATSIYVVNHGWHTGIVVQRDDIPDDVWPEHHDFPQATYIEVGWGDQDFYQAPKATLGLAFKAVFQTTPSVLYITGFTMPATFYFPDSDVIEVLLSQQGFERLCAFMHETYKRDERGETLPLGHGSYGTSQFYQAKGTYHLFNTCNSWTAKALRAAGCPITPSQAITAENVMHQASRFGNVIRAKSIALHQQETFCRPNN
jgi:uncharacterized protein (TIGR02117 family)